MKQIYTGNGVPNFIRIARVLYKILQKKPFGFLFFWTHCKSSTVASCKIFDRFMLLGVPVDEKATGSRFQPFRRNGAIGHLSDHCLLRHNYRNKTDAVNCLVTVMSGCRKQMWLKMSGNIENVGKS